MPAPLVVVTGTGTGIGKTHFAEALLRAWTTRRGARVAGLKPVESGVAAAGAPSSDAARLDAVSTFHVKHQPPVLPDPVSPHLAARRRGLTLHLEMFSGPVAHARAHADGVVLELPGGLFTPLAPNLLNVHVARDLRPDLLLLVAPDRLGVLHDVLAATAAARAMSTPVRGVVLVAPEHADASTGTNEAELAAFADVPVLAALPRASPDRLAAQPALQIILRLVAP